MLCDAFSVKPTRPLLEVATKALSAKTRVYVLQFADNDKVWSKDISSLDPGSDDSDVTGWGGLAGFSENFSNAVRRAANEAD